MGMIGRVALFLIRIRIYPVCNIASYPLRFSKNETLADYGMDEPTLSAKLDELNPIIRL
jgi:hypothetical protein